MNWTESGNSCSGRGFEFPVAGNFARLVPLLLYAAAIFQTFEPAWGGQNCCERVTGS